MQGEAVAPYQQHLVVEASHFVPVGTNVTPDIAASVSLGYAGSSPMLYWVTVKLPTATPSGPVTHLPLERVPDEHFVQAEAVHAEHPELILEQALQDLLETA